MAGSSGKRKPLARSQSRPPDGACAVARSQWRGDDMTTTLTTTTPGTTQRRPHWLRRTARDSVYLFTGFPIAIVSFSVLVSLFATGASLLITLVGLPVIVLTWLLARQFARLERRRIGWVSGRPAAEPAYRPRTGGWVGTLVAMACDPQAV